MRCLCRHSNTHTSTHAVHTHTYSQGVVVRAGAPADRPAVVAAQNEQRPLPHATRPQRLNQRVDDVIDVAHHSVVHAAVGDVDEREALLIPRRDLVRLVRDVCGVVQEERLAAATAVCAAVVVVAVYDAQRLRQKQRLLQCSFESHERGRNEGRGNGGRKVALVCHGVAVRQSRLYPISVPKKCPDPKVYCGRPTSGLVVTTSARVGRERRAVVAPEVEHLAVAALVRPAVAVVLGAMRHPAAVDDAAALSPLEVVVRVVKV